MDKALMRKLSAIAASILLIQLPCFGQGILKPIIQPSGAWGGAPTYLDSWAINGTSHTLATAASSGQFVAVMCTSFASSLCLGSITASTPSYTWQCPDTGSLLTVCYICPGTNTSGLTAINVNGTGLGQILEISQIAGTTGTTCLDSVGTLGNINTGTTWITNSTTRSNATDYCVGFNASNSTSTGMTVTTAGYTLIHNDASSEGSQGTAGAHFGSTGSGTVGGAQPSGSTNGYADLICFKATG